MADGVQTRCAFVATLDRPPRCGCVIGDLAILRGLRSIAALVINAEACVLGAAVAVVTVVVFAAAGFGQTAANHVADGKEGGV